MQNTTTLPYIKEVNDTPKSMITFHSHEEERFALQQRQAIAFFKSAYFPDLKSEAQAITKVLAGAELGLKPFASLNGIHIVQGKPVLSAGVIACLVSSHPDYDYRVSTPAGKDKEICAITFYKLTKDVREELGTATFTVEEAQAAGLMAKDNWKKYTSDMLFARTISRGARRFVPAIFNGGTVYTPEELGRDTDEDGVIIGE